MERHFLTLAEIAPGLCKSKKSLENLVGEDGAIRLGQRRLQTIKISATRVVSRAAYDALILDLLREAGVSPGAAARLVSRQPEPQPQPKEEEVTSTPLRPPRRRAGRPRAGKKGGEK